MLYYYASIAYTIINLLLAIVIVGKSPKNLLTRFYALCVGCLILFGTGANLLSEGITDGKQGIMPLLVELLFCLIPFFFLHFAVIFLRQYDLMKSRSVVFGIYFAGLFSYVMLASGYLPELTAVGQNISSWSYIYYLTWTSIFCSIGIVILHSMSKGFAEKKVKSNYLMIGFASLLLFLPSPFTYSVSRAITASTAEWFGLTSATALIVAVYMIFRYKIMSTIYDSIKSALIVMNDIFMMTDEHFCVETATGSIQQLLGVSEKELVGKSLNDFIEPKDYLPAYGMYVRKNKMKEGRFDAEVKQEKGKKFTINFSFSPVFENERLSGFVGIGRDVTNEKLLEEKHRESQKLESVSTLAAGIATDFTSLLTVVMGYAQLIELARSDVETLSSSVDEIKKAVRKGSGLVRQISTFARRTGDNFETLQVNDVINELLLSLKETMPITITLKSMLGESLPSIQGDKGAIIQALQNLCTNSREAMMPDGGALTITTKLTFAEDLINRFESGTTKKYIGIFVKDTGRGMAQDVKGRIFEPFFTTKESSRGAGLGLAVVYGVVRSHSGHIDVESEPGKGTTFSMFLPVEGA
ncbi:MAG: PAS domain-containing hybrid sensor histidine kinase/response regulator [Bacteroidetes bacterium]|nr:MAG: PAS domain-containing hybrid sensor histidine kinase/response regulator [Bacteroidota bacterium]